MLAQLMEAYCKKVQRDPKSVRFLFNGLRVGADDTPDKLEMEDGDSMDAMVEQSGGY